MSYSYSSLETSLAFAAAFLTFLLICIVAIKDRQSFVGRNFIACLTSLAFIQFFLGLSIQADTPHDALQCEQLRTVFAAVQPGIFLMFSLAYARAEYRTYFTRWKYVIVAAFAAPVLTLALLRPAFMEYPPLRGPLSPQIIPLGYAGKIFYSTFLVSAVLILANLERTLRASTGRIRWQIKFVVLGMSSICAIWIYISGQVLIYSALDTSYYILYPVSTIAANLLFLWGLVRSQFFNVDVYLSRTTIQYSLTAILASIYLISVGILAYLAHSFNRQWSLPLDALVVIFALSVLAMLLLSDRLQEKIKRFVTRHFHRPIHDYRKAWMDLIEKTNSLMDAHDLCAVVSRIISQTFGILSVNIWLCDEAKETLYLTGSTVFTPAQAMELERSGPAVSELIKAVDGQFVPLDLEDAPFDWADEIMRAKPQNLKEFKMRYILPLRAGTQLVGIMTLNSDRVGKKVLSLEDFDLLNAYASQLAARVIQLRLSENLRRAREVESFQNVLTFFVHDLKNMASRLSLTMQNLSAYFDNPEFRGDALKLIGNSVAKIETTCSRLSWLRQKLQLKIGPSDLNGLLTTTLNDFENSGGFHFDRDFQQLPLIPLDSEQIQHVVTNLIMNARDAMKGQGIIHVTTSASNHQAVLSIKDSGCGMSRQFIEKMLFRPFTSTKKRGMGIGLFHSKMIVEAHRGRIEVDSEEGKGSTFRVILPS
jgi:putative PEP-CTERM system histidine kinase